MKMKMKVDKKRLQKKQSKLTLLSHITKHYCALLPYLNVVQYHHTNSKVKCEAALKSKANIEQRQNILYEVD